MATDADGRRLKKTILRGGLVLGIVILSLYVFRVFLVETVGSSLLRNNGFDQASFTVKQVGFGEIQLADIALDEHFTIENLSVGFSPASLAGGSVDWVSVSGVHVDISKPDEGALKTLIGYGSSSDNDTESPEQIVSPSISVTQAEIIGSFDNRHLQSKLSFDLTPEFEITGEVLASAEIGTDNGAIQLENLAVNFAGNAVDQTGHSEITGGVVRHDADMPDWAPMTVSGTADINKQMVTFMAKVGLGVETPLFRMEGRHDLGENIGGMDVDVHDIIFDKGGLQPGNLLASLTFIPPLDTVLSSQSKVSWNRDEIEAESLIFAKDNILIGPDFSVESGLINVVVKAFYNLKSGDHRISVVTEDMTALVSKGDRKYAVDELTTNLDFEQGGRAFSLHDLRVSLRHVATNPDFVPLVLQMVAKTKGGDLVFEGTVTDEAERLSLPFDGRHNMAAKVGFVRGTLKSARFIKTGLQPKDLSSLLGQIPGTVTGRVNVDGIAKWDSENGVTLGGMKGTFKKGGYEHEDLVARDLELTVEARDIPLNKPVTLNFSKISGALSKGERAADIKDMAGQLLIQENWKDADFQLQTATIIPKKGMAIKPAIKLAGSAHFQDQMLEFEGTAQTDTLGEFAGWSGQHDITSQSGTASIVIVPVEFETDGLQLADLLAQSDPNLVLDGKLSSEIHLKWQGDEISSSAIVKFDALDVKNDEVEIVGLTGDVDIDALQPLSVSAPQELYADRVMAGVALVQPTVRFRVKTENEVPVLYLDELKVGFIGGNATIRNAILDTGSETNSVNIELSNIDLEEIMALGDVEDFSASGTLNGQIPILFDDGNLLIDTGLLETEGPGVLQLKSDEARQSLASGGDQTELLFDILENFQYSELSVQINKSPSGEDTVLLHTKGANPDVENSRPVVLNINLTTNLDKIFETLLNGYRLSEKALRATVKDKKK